MRWISFLVFLSCASLVSAAGAVIDTIEEGETKEYNLDGNKYIVENKIVTDSLETQMILNGEPSSSLQRADQHVFSDKSRIVVMDVVSTESGEGKNDYVKFALSRGPLKEAVCGDGICAEEDCCVDCGCSQGFECVDNSCVSSDDCVLDGDCDDGDECTRDICSGAPKKCANKLVCFEDAESPVLSEVTTATDIAEEPIVHETEQELSLFQKLINWFKSIFA